MHKSLIFGESCEKKVKKVIALSTDKAAAPINLYGATKLCSDKLMINGNFYANQFLTKFSVVRYGNVIGSRGSVLPYFKSLIEKDTNYLPITDEKMTRFIMSISDASKMILKVTKIAKDGEIFIFLLEKFAL